MHVHGPQLNPNAQFDAVCAAQRAQADREAAAIRKKLMESASKLAGSSGANIWSIRAQQENAEGRPKQKHEQEGGEKGGAEQENPACFTQFGELLASFLIR